MPGWIARLLRGRRPSRLNRLLHLAAEGDALLLQGKLSPAARMQVEQGRERLEQQIRQLLA